MIGKFNRFQIDLRYAYRVAKRDLVGTNVNWHRRRFTAFANSPKKRPAEPLLAGRVILGGTGNSARDLRSDQKCRNHGRQADESEKLIH
jgi:hypothetical protein